MPLKKCALRIQITHTYTLTNGQCQLILMETRDDPIEGDTFAHLFRKLNTLNEYVYTIILMSTFDDNFYKHLLCGIYDFGFSCVNHAIY